MRCEASREGRLETQLHVSDGNSHNRTRSQQSATQIGAQAGTAALYPLLSGDKGNKQLCFLTRRKKDRQFKRQVVLLPESTEELVNYLRKTQGNLSL